MDMRGLAAGIRTPSASDEALRSGRCRKGGISPVRRGTGLGLASFGRQDEIGPREELMRIEACIPEAPKS